MEIVYSAENRKDILHLPIIPEELDIAFPHINMTIQTINEGEINIIGLPGLKTISYKSWIPNRKYSFAKSNVMGPRAKEFFTKWKRKRRPIRIVITSKNGWELHNELYAIEEIIFGYDRVGDLTYSLSLKQATPKQVKK